MVNINFPAQDLAIIEQISEDVSFIEAMMNLRSKDIVEYNLKLSQFKAQVEQQKSCNTNNTNRPKCPYCNSTNTKKITGMSKAGSVALFGVFAMGKISKEWHCNNCKSDF